MTSPRWGVHEPGGSAIPKPRVCPDHIPPSLPPSFRLQDHPREPGLWGDPEQESHLTTSRTWHPWLLCCGNMSCSGLLGFLSCPCGPEPVEPRSSELLPSPRPWGKPFLLLCACSSWSVRRLLVVWCLWWCSAQPLWKAPVSGASSGQRDAPET